MSPLLQIVLGLFFMASGGFVVVQGLRARKAQSGPWPTFFRIAFMIHIGIALIGLALAARGILAASGM
jgi:hypothetical protein